MVPALALWWFFNSAHPDSPPIHFASLDKRDEWTAYGGTWEAVDGAMRNNSDERGAKLMTGSADWRNYSVEADIQLLGQFGDAGLILRARNEEEGVDAYNGYFAGLRTLDDSLILGRADFGWREYRVVPINPRVNTQTWYHLKFLAYECDFVATATSPSGETTTTAIRNRNCLQSGRFGLKSYATGALWRNVQIRPASRTDEIAMIGPDAPPIGHPADVVGGAAYDSLARNLDPIYRSMQNPRFDSHAVPINNLRLLAPNKRTQVTVRGIVTLTTPVLFIQDSTGGLAISRNDQRLPLEIGDEVEASGDLVLGDFSSVLKDKSIRILWSHSPVPAVVVTASQAATGNFDAVFVEIEGVLERKQEGPNRSLIMTMRSGSENFRVIVGSRGRGSFPWRLQEGSRLRLHGICVVDPTYTHNETPFAVILPAIDDIQVMEGPPWWSTGHIVAGIIVLLLVGLAAQAIHSRVNKMKLRAVFEERERLAHDMHDTLAQSFAGIGFQLQAIRDEVGNEEELREHIDLANDLVRASHEEARRSITALRSNALADSSLLEALDQSARRIVNGGSMQVQTFSKGNPGGISPRVVDAFFRIGQEAIANAVRHSGATTLTIAIAYEQATVRLLVEDNGRGFPVGEDSAGFGIRSMGKRAESIGAVLEIRSSPGNGTSVQLESAPPKRTLSTVWQEYTSKS
ncbi:two-component system sensor kinase [Acidisarcina polymorpha]|uniref:Two-component system sensor kinase n=1 Tax=Acidisarcina polymorpha TaxID=2211140 RepID=A0A2Z5FV74_9BACT|nr:two-component system sensor kinase [Acidisarcina polymorpha]